MKKNRIILRTLACVSLIFNFQFSILNSASAQVPVRFTLNNRIDGAYKAAVPVRIVLVDPDGRADTLASPTLRPRKHVERRRPAGIGMPLDSPSQSNLRSYDRQLAATGDYRLRLTVDTCTFELPFSIDGSELLVHAGVVVEWYDTTGMAYPAIRIFRPAPPEVKLYYLGVDTAKREPLFNLVNRSEDTLYDGLRNNFDVRLWDYSEGLPEQFEQHWSYSYRVEAPLAPGRSRRLYDSFSGSGRFTATLCYTTSPYAHFSAPGYATYHGCIFHSRPVASVYWRDIDVDTWFIARCDLFLSALDFNP
ncbi:MAG: hypothetical protein IJ634_04820 [Bacteroidales bacterium]|nr:hypothetical protein [Bacteroidales bacterium]